MRGLTVMKIRKAFPFGRSLATIASRQIPAKSFALNGSLATNGRVILSQPRTIVFRPEQYLESTERNWVTLEGAGADGSALKEIVPLSDTHWITTSNAFSTVTDIKIAYPERGYLTVGVSQSAEAVARSLIDCTAYLIANGMPRGAYHVA